MNAMMIVSAVVAVLGALAVWMSVHFVPQSQMIVVERLGRYHKTMSGGFNCIIPFIDQKRQTFSNQQQLLDIPPQSVITRDNVGIKIDGVVFLRVNDARQACYEVDDLKNSIGQLAQTTLRSEIGRMNLDDTLSSREEMNASLLAALDEASSDWGTKVMRVEVKNIQVPKEVEEAMILQMKAVRQRRAMEEEAAGQKTSAVLRSEGELEASINEAKSIERMAEARKKEEVLLAEAARDRQILRGEGQRKELEELVEALKDNPGVADFLLAKDRVEAFKGLAASDSSNKVVVPYEVSELLGSLSVAKSFLNGNQQNA